MIAQIATKNELKFKNSKGDYVIRSFNDKSLEVLRDSINSSNTTIPIELTGNGTKVGKVNQAWIENNGLFVEFFGETFEKRYLVPSMMITSSKGAYFQTVRCHSLLLTNNPVDKSLLDMNLINTVIQKDGDRFYFLDGDEKIGPYNSFTEANKAMLEHENLI